MKYPKNTIFFVLTLALLANTTTYTAEAADQDELEALEALNDPTLDLLSLEQLIQQRKDLEEDFQKTITASKELYDKQRVQTNDPFEKHFAEELNGHMDASERLDALKEELRRTNPQMYRILETSIPQTRDELDEEEEEQNGVLGQLIQDLTRFTLAIERNGGTPEQCECKVLAQFMYDIAH